MCFSSVSIILDERLEPFVVHFPLLILDERLAADYSVIHESGPAFEPVWSVAQLSGLTDFGPELVEKTDGGPGWFNKVPARRGRLV